MTAHRLALAAALFAAALLAGCAERPSLRVGHVAGRPANALMAEVVAQTLRHQGVRAVVTECPTPVACGRQIQAGDLDLWPTYSGTARAFVHRSAIAGGRLKTVRRVLRAAGLDATPPLGFSAPYRLVMPAPRAAEQGIRDIGDLSELESPRFAVPPGYTRQPGDGLLALARRYGLDIRPGQVAEVRAPAERLAQTLDGEADIAVLRMPEMANDRLTALNDTLAFYPDYTATVVLGAKAAAQGERIQAWLAPLFGRITADTIRPLLRENVLHGRAPAALASRLLVDLGVLDVTGPSVRRPEMTLVRGSAEVPGALAERALLTVRRAFPERPVAVIARRDPAAALRTGAAELALVHTSAFFRLDWRGGYDGRDRRLEAIAPVARRPFLLLTRPGRATSHSNPLTRRVGIPPATTAAGRVAARILALTGQRPEHRAPVATLMADLRAGELDAAIVLLGPVVREALTGDDGAAIRAGGLTAWLDAPPFFLNAQRLPAGSVPGTAEAVDTLSMQLVLAGPAPRGGPPGPVHGGPASTTTTGGLPVPLREAERLAEAAEPAEPLEPVLPSFRDRAARRGARDAETGWLETGLIVGALAYLAWAVSLLVRRNPRPM